MSGQAAERNATPGVIGLDPESYTAKRLQHGSPHHIHATSRRCFIGPIPGAWLSRHRKSWYRYRPHLSTYSSKAATFDATDNVSFTKKLGSLGSDAPHTSLYTGPSFPQPDDVSADDPITTVEPSSPDSLRPSGSVGLTTNTRKSLPKTVSFHETRNNRKKDPSSPPAEAQSTSRPPAAPRLDSGKTEGNASFVTAFETLSEQPTRTRDVPRPLSTVESRDSQAESSLAPRPRQSTGSSHDADPVTSTGKTAHGSNSQSSLLQKGSTKASSNVSATADGNSTKTDPASDEGTESPKFLKEVNPVSTGLVQFDLSNLRNRTQSVLAPQPKATAFAALFQSHTKPGELIKAERMLVRVDQTKSDLPSNFNENEGMRIESTQVEKWREYMVVCRRPSEDSFDPEEGSDPEESFVLQMSRSRIIPMIDLRRTSGRCAHEVVLHRRSTRVNLYSSLDKTIVLWSKTKKGNRIYVLRPRSSIEAVEWYTFFNSLLGWRRPQVLPIHVPDLNVTLSIDKPFHSLLSPLEESESENDTESSAIQEFGKGTIAYNLVDRSMRLLEHSPVSGNLHTWLQKGDRIGLAWKHYDRLEWVHGMNEKKMYGSMAMQQSHDLELRLKQHYPTSVAMGETKHSPVEEPAPVEGFLIRLTSQKGRHKRFGKQFFKRLYFSTHDQYLCFSEPSKALPPKPPKMIEGKRQGSLPKASELAGHIPLIYPVNPFPLKDGQIAWLAERSGSSRTRMDEVAVEESERKIQTLLTAHGYINLCQIQEVRKARSSPPGNGESQDPEEVDPAEWTDGEMSIPEDARPTSSTSEDSIFELVMKNGLTVRLQAYDKLACREWIKRLRRLAAYWKHRTAADMMLYKSTRQQNLKALAINEEMESAMGQFAEKWEVSRAIASAELFNMCGISCCRSITMSGTLYYKPRYRSKFRRSTVILSNGKLLIFQDTLRTSAGMVVDHIHHERQTVLSLEDTYIYSGLITEGDLLYQNQTFDSNNPGHHALRRVYLEDQWTSSDEDTMTCFVIWYRKSKSLFRAPTEQDNGKTQHKLRYVSTLGRPGRAVVFKTRSRAERDHWVMSISLEIDRIARSEDLRVVNNDSPSRPTPM